MNTSKENDLIHLMVANVISHVLNQVILELHMSMPFTHFTMKLDELFKHCRFLMLRHNIFIMLFKPLVIDVVILLILHDHVVHDLTSSRHFPKLVGAPCQCRVSNDSSSRLKHTKSTLVGTPTYIDEATGYMCTVIPRINAHRTPQTKYQEFTSITYCLTQPFW